MCLGMSDFDTTSTHIVILNYMIFLNNYRYQPVNVYVVSNIHVSIRVL